MSKISKPVQGSRREFLKGVAAAGGAATLATMASGAAAEVDPKQVETTAKQSKGYHETPHIRAYYDRARL